MEYLIRLTQTHENFRIAEIQALATLNNVELEILSYCIDSPFCLVRLPSEEAAIRLIQRSILAKGIYELWGKGSTYDALFSFDAFQATRSVAEQRRLFNSFHFLEFEGPIRMKGAEQEFCIFEHWKIRSNKNDGANAPEMIYLGRYLGESDRDIIQKFDLKKRRYICTTSMDAELALITANITLAAPTKLFYDPFVGSGSFPIACAYFGVLSFGSDIDGRSIRGKGRHNLFSNFIQYGLKNYFGDSFVADLTNSPVRRAKIFDGIICDPPYGVREGLKVLGSRNPAKGKVPVIYDGHAHHTMDSYVPPKKPYSFLDMLDDILEFAAISLIDNGRLSFWMPIGGNSESQQIKIPRHPCLEITSICTQNFSNWSRQLLTYRRILDSESTKLGREHRTKTEGQNADDLNPFRKAYFQGFKSESIGS